MRRLEFSEPVRLITDSKQGLLQKAEQTVGELTFADAPTDLHTDAY